MTAKKTTKNEPTKQPKTTRVPLTSWLSTLDLATRAVRDLAGEEDLLVVEAPAQPTGLGPQTLEVLRPSQNHLPKRVLSTLAVCADTFGGRRHYQVLGHEGHKFWSDDPYRGIPWVSVEETPSFFKALSPWVSYARLRGMMAEVLHEKHALVLLAPGPGRSMDEYLLEPTQTESLRGYAKTEYRVLRRSMDGLFQLITTDKEHPLWAGPPKPTLTGKLLHGEKTHPLKPGTKAALLRFRGSMGHSLLKWTFNPGVVDRLRRGGLVEDSMLAEKPALKLTQAGRDALSALLQETKASKR